MTFNTRLGAVPHTKPTKEEFIERAAKVLEEQLTNRGLTTIEGLTPRAWMTQVLERGISYNNTATGALRKLRIQHLRKQPADIFLLRCLREYQHGYCDKSEFSF